ncbi:MAG: YqjD family protein [Opitutales bacterium]
MASHNINLKPASREQIAADLEMVIKEAQDLLKNTAEDTYDEAKETVSHGVHALERELEEARAKLESYESDAATAIRANPWQSIGIALGVGVALGIFFGRK